MTEAEWLASTDPDATLAFLRGQASDRKWRLWGAACARRALQAAWAGSRESRDRNAQR